MEFNVGQLNEAETALSSSLRELTNAYNTDWSDPVHDSFQNYLLDLTGRIQSLAALMEGVKQTLAELAPVDAEALEGEYSSLESQYSGAI